MNWKIVKTRRDRVRPSGFRVASVPLVIGALVVLLGVTGCDDGPRIVGAQREFEEQAERARDNAKEREAAHRRTVRVQGEMHRRLRPARHPTFDCKVEYAPIRPQGGIEPIACGNLVGAWPLTVRRGYLRCEPSIRKNFERVIFVAPDGSEYAVNASAHGVGYLGIKVILKGGRGGSGASLENLTERGLGLCRGVR